MTLTIANTSSHCEAYWAKKKRMPFWYIGAVSNSVRQTSPPATSAGANNSKMQRTSASSIDEYGFRIVDEGAPRRACYCWH